MWVRKKRRSEQIVQLRESLIVWEMFNMAEFFLSPRRHFRFLHDCKSFTCTLRLQFSQERRSKDRRNTSRRLCSVSVAYPASAERLRCGFLPFLKHFLQIDKREIHSPALPREMYCREKQERVREGKSAREIGPTERFIGSNEDVGAVQVVT